MIVRMKNNLHSNYKPYTCVVYSIKSDSHLPKKHLFILFDENPLKMMKKSLYFILKALFVLKIFNFCLDILVM